ncbi:MAG: DUF1343 domain-containing protein [Gemmatales bacterium]
MRALFCIVALLVVGFASAAPQHALTTPALASELQAAVHQAIQAKQIPGAVILVLHQGQVLHHAAYGHRALVPQAEPMTTDTLFDMASMTKPIATVTCIMKLYEQGKLQLTDKASQHLPSFQGHGKEAITIAQLLLHVGGLIADNAQEDFEHGYEEALRRIDALKLQASPGTRFIYSDIGYIVLGRIVEKLTGKPLDQVAQEWVFTPLGMKDTGFHRLPGTPRLLARIAPTEVDNGQMLRGIVHDPRGQRLNGVAGHAGLFTTSSDMQRFLTMLLNQGAPILKPETICLFTQAHHLPGGNLRTYGWDVDTFYSAPRGDAFPVGLSFGHTGFTGTSAWIDPTSETAVLILTSRLHPDGKGNAVPLRRTVADIVGKHLNRKPARSAVRVGIDVLRQGYFKAIETKRIGLVTNHTGVARDGMSTIDILHQASNIKLVALFSPEHGIRGQIDEKVKDSIDARTGLPVYSLYGEHRKPTAEQLHGIDILVYDVQDIGCRFYTYISTLGLVLEAAAAQNIPVVVLDRPNPVNGITVQGPMLDAGRESFIAWHRLPVRHGMTVGELAQLFNAERKIGARLTVIPMKDWRRSDDYSQTGLAWVNPSPNMRSLYAAWLYPGVGLLEMTNLSVGRGTDRPFETIGAPWIDSTLWASHLALEKVPGVRFMPTRFTSTSSMYAGKECQGVSMVMEDVSKVNPIQVGLALGVTLKRLYPRDWQTRNMNTLLLCEEVTKGIEQGKPVAELLKLCEKNLESFLEVRKKYLLYEK